MKRASSYLLDLSLQKAKELDERILGACEDGMGREHLNAGIGIDIETGFLPDRFR